MGHQSQTEHVRDLRYSPVTYTYKHTHTFKRLKKQHYQAKRLPTNSGIYNFNFTPSMAIWSTHSILRTHTHTHKTTFCSLVGFFSFMSIGNIRLGVVQTFLNLNQTNNQLITRKIFTKSRLAFSESNDEPLVLLSLSWVHPSGPPDRFTNQQLHLL